MITIGESSGIRIVGQGGAAVFMEALALPSQGRGIQLGLDISILSPDRLVTYLARAVPDQFPDRLGAFLREASVADEGIVISFEEAVAGLLITTKPIDSMWVEMDIQVAENLEDDVLEFDGINFETNRASLLIAAQEAERLRWARESEGE